jgi:hypothetical protein
MTADQKPETTQQVLSELFGNPCGNITLTFESADRLNFGGFTQATKVVNIDFYLWSDNSLPDLNCRVGSVIVTSASRQDPIHRLWRCQAILVHGPETDRILRSLLA